MRSWGCVPWPGSEFRRNTNIKVAAAPKQTISVLVFCFVLFGSHLTFAFPRDPFGFYTSEWVPYSFSPFAIIVAVFSAVGSTSEHFNRQRAMFLNLYTAIYSDSTVNLYDLYLRTRLYVCLRLLCILSVRPSSIVGGGEIRNMSGKECSSQGNRILKHCTACLHFRP